MSYTVKSITSLRALDRMKSRVRKQADPMLAEVVYHNTKAQFHMLEMQTGVEEQNVSLRRIAIALEHAQTKGEQV
jgi:hypothetical protein